MYGGGVPQKFCVCAEYASYIIYLYLVYIDWLDVIEGGAIYISDQQSYWRHSLQLWKPINFHVHLCTKTTSLSFLHFFLSRTW